MNTERIKEIQADTAFPESVSVMQALMKVWNECASEYREEGRQEIRDAVAELRRYRYYTNIGMQSAPLGPYVRHEDLASALNEAPKPQRYVVAPAGAELEPGEIRVSYDGVGPVYLKPGWTSDKECRDIVAKLLRGGVEVREA